MSMSVGDLQVTTYNPPPGFDPLTTASDADLVKNGFPPRQKNPELQARYEQILNQLKGKLHYIPATVRQRDEISHGPRQRLASAGTETSTNWSGGSCFPPAGQSFYCVEGDWVVPDIDAPNQPVVLRGELDRDRRGRLGRRVQGRHRKPGLPERDLGR